MLENLRSLMRHQVPALARRDELLAQRAEQLVDSREALEAAQEQVRLLEAKLRRQRRRGRAAAAVAPAPSPPSDSALQPSFLRQMRDLRRGVHDLNELDPTYSHPLAQVPRKLRNYRLAASHGVAPPPLYATWESLAEVDLSVLPDDFVMKADRGAGGRGVLPLRRRDVDAYQMVASGQVLTQHEVVEHFRSSNPPVGAPFFAEKLLLDPSTGSLPDDIKLYMFYGEIGHIVMCRVSREGGRARKYFRLLDGTGADLGPDVAPTRPIDSSISVPKDLPRLLRAARHLSRAVALPFIRVDLYETEDGPMFGELTCGPGGKQIYRPDHDARLGWLWENGQYRLDLDVVAGRPLQNLHGEHPVSPIYRAASGSHASAAERADARVLCARWCEPDGAAPSHGVPEAAS